jgi:hypothetical protein
METLSHTPKVCPRPANHRLRLRAPWPQKTAKPARSCNHHLVPLTTPSPVHQYLADLRTAHSLGSHTAETTFYTPLANLLNTIGKTLKPRVHFQAHPGTHGAGLADGGLFPIARSTQPEPLPGQLPERGAVEIKPPGYSLATLAQSPQVRRYLETYHLCLITNYHQFQLLSLLHGQPHILENYDLTLTSEALWTLPLKVLADQHAQTLPDFLLRVMTRKVPLEKPKDVAWLLASYAREARANAATHPPGNRNTRFHGRRGRLRREKDTSDPPPYSRPARSRAI